MRTGWQKLWKRQTTPPLRSSRARQCLLGWEIGCFYFDLFFVFLFLPSGLAVHCSRPLQHLCHLRGGKETQENQHIDWFSVLHPQGCRPSFLVSEVSGCLLNISSMELCLKRSHTKTWIDFILFLNARLLILQLGLVTFSKHRLAI